METKSGKNAFNSGDSPFLTRAVDSAWGRPARPAGAQEPIKSLETNKPLLSGNNRQSDAVEIVDGLVDGAIYRPTRAIKQVFGLSDQTETGSAPADDTPVRRTGQVVGSLVPFVGLVGLTRGASSQILGEARSPTVYRLLGEQATAGFLLGSLLTPSQLRPGEDLLSARLNQGGISAATFASITGTTAELDRDLPRPDDNSGLFPNLARRLSVSILSGAVGQFTDIQGKTSFGAPVEDNLSSSLSSVAFDSLTDKAGNLVNYFIEQNTNNSTLRSRIMDATKTAAGTGDRTALTNRKDSLTP